jgi:shikimate kinase
LRADAATLAERTANGGHRPSMEPIAVLAARRDPSYAAVADQTIDVETNGVDRIVAAVLG